MEEGFLPLPFKVVEWLLGSPSVISTENSFCKIVSWKIQKEERSSHIWASCYYKIEEKNFFSVAGDKEILKELFGVNVKFKAI